MVKDFNFRHFAYPFSIWKLKRFLDGTESWTKEQLIEYQTERLKRIINYANKYVPYYKKLFDDNRISPADIQSIDDLQIIPPLTKEIVRERFDDLTSIIYKKFDSILTQTSGSTGTPLKLYLDKHINTARFAYYWRIWGWTGYRFGQKWASLRGSVFEDGSVYKYARLMNALYISSFQLTEENSKIILDELIKFNPNMLRGYPSSLYEFAKFIEGNHQVEELNLNNIVTDSETLLDSQREYLQDVFKTKVYDSYGQWESVCLIAECNFQNKHHLMEHGILELLGGNNTQVNNGELGEITATGFYNKAMPLIRYKNRDLAVRNETVCQCGRAHDVIKRIDGRIEDIIITPDGRHVGRLDAAFKYNKGYDFAQIVQSQRDSIDVLLVKNDKYDKSEEQLLEKHIRARIGHEMKIDFKFVKAIEKQKNGKIRFLVNNYSK